MLVASQNAAPAAIVLRDPEHRMEARARRVTKRALETAGWLDHARRGRTWVRSRRQQLFLRRLVPLYAHPMSRPSWDLTEWHGYERERRRERMRTRFADDAAEVVDLLCRHVLAAPGDVPMPAPLSTELVLERMKAQSQARDTSVGRAALAIHVIASHGNGLVDAGAIQDGLHRILDRGGRGQATVGSHQRHLRAGGPLQAVLELLLEPGGYPVGFEYDFLDDLVPIVESRYESGDGLGLASGRVMLDTLAALCGLRGGDDRALVAELKRRLGAAHPFKPRRGEVDPVVPLVIPDLVDELISLRAADDPARFIEINREYSWRQRQRRGDYGGLSLLAGMERERHMMLRTFVELRATGRLGRDEEVLIVGPRHADELTFFRRHLRMRATGLDLFTVEKHGISGGDMHDMHFPSGRFRAIYCNGTLSYSYAIRTVVSEMARVVKRPGFVVLSDAAQRVAGVDPLGRTDPISAEALISCVYPYRHHVLAADAGRSPSLHQYKSWPSVVLELA